MAALLLGPLAEHYRRNRKYRHEHDALVLQTLAKLLRELEEINPRRRQL